MNRLLTLVFVLLSLAVNVHADGINKLFIVPADENGTIASDGNGGYVGQIELTADTVSGHIYTAGNIDVPYGKFAIYGIIGTNGRYTFYGINSWAVKPMPVNYPSPLLIASDGTLLELPVSGVFDFEFYDRDMDGITYNMLVPVPSDQTIDAKYPQKLFLVDSANKYVALNGDMNTGIYTGDVALPDNFRISYEPRFDISAFIFGPADDQMPTVDLIDDIPQPIKYAVGTSSVFNPSTLARQRTYTHVEVNLPNGYIILHDPTVTGVESVVTDVADSEYYTLSGCRMQGVPERPGVYIVRRGDTCTKVVVHGL